jgi:hypothetical protein
MLNACYKFILNNLPVKAGIHYIIFFETAGKYYFTPHLKNVL